jgi:hypothetical protein
MPLTDWRKAFGFDDNPFNPSQPLGGMASAEWMVDLAVEPLPIHREPKLSPLFCDRAGDFERALKSFDHRLGVAGYRPGGAPGGPTAGRQSFLIFIAGPKGTGKTTLANVMVERVFRCRPAGVAWRYYDAYTANPPETAREQREGLEALKKAVNADDPRHCCVVLDNLLSDVVTPALNLSREIRKPPRCLFLFLLTSEPDWIGKSWDNDPRRVVAFATRELTPEHAIAFVRSRLALYRPQLPPILDRFPLFPFDGDDLRRLVVRRQAAGRDGARHRDGSITLRQFSNYLDQALLERLESLADDFDLAGLAPGQVEPHLIRLEQAVERMVA